MKLMNTVHAPDRRNPRAIRIAKVKFVALPLELPDELAFAPALEPAAPVKSLVESLRAFIIRVIGRLEAARP